MDRGEWTMKEGALQIKSFAFAIRALAREAEQAESKADFVRKMAIALKEANKTENGSITIFRYQLSIIH